MRKSARYTAQQNNEEVALQSSTEEDIKGDGLSGKRITFQINRFSIYLTTLETTKAVVIRKGLTQNWLQFHYQLSGRTKTVKIEGQKEIHTQPNSLSIIYEKAGSCEIHFPEGCTYNSFGFTVAPDYFMNSFLKDFKELQPLRKALVAGKLFFLDEEYSRLDSRTREIIAAIRNNPYSGNLREVFIENKLIDLIFYSIPLLRQHKNALVNNGRSYDNNVLDAQQYILDNLDQRLSLKQIAKHAGLNEYTLKTKFKETFGRSVIDYCIELKLNRAYSEIQNTDKKITVIAYETGYASLGNFSNAFFKRYAIRPSEARGSKN
ncbi:helix-turn-helix domain-containing protein [Spongiimicrobium sp. 3-5]|uniref:helix-turn-helix domain-containing protein n=1 Tax=Spongiimicrobium sp. 3-5 TaxID=3332596 RepID=UPI0039804301